MEVGGDMDMCEEGREWEGTGEEGGRRRLEPYSFHCFPNQSLLKQVSV